MDLNKLELKILLDCEDDVVSILNVIRMQDFKVPTSKPAPENILKAGFAAIHNLLNLGFIVAGHLERDGTFKQLNLSADEVMMRIGEEKKKYDDIPLYYGFFLWFRITKEGEKVAQRAIDKL
jgi:hypothetical protein